MRGNRKEQKRTDNRTLTSFESSSVSEICWGNCGGCWSVSIWFGFPCYVVIDGPTLALRLITSRHPGVYSVFRCFLLTERSKVTATRMTTAIPIGKMTAIGNTAGSGPLGSVDELVAVGATTVLEANA